MQNLFVYRLNRWDWVAASSIDAAVGWYSSHGRHTIQMAKQVDPIDPVNTPDGRRLAFVELLAEIRRRRLETPRILASLGSVVDIVPTYHEAAASPPEALPTLVYVAGPYSHPDPEVRNKRFYAHTLYAAVLQHRGRAVYAPITYGHAMAAEFPHLGYSFEHWRGLAEAMLPRCTSMHILMLPGADKSLGLRTERALARRCGIPQVEVAWNESCFIAELRQGRGAEEEAVGV